MELVCIVCPKGCRMTVENGVVTGNTCKKGEAFAKSEATCPMRTVCSTVAAAFDSMTVLPVRTDGEIPKSKIGELMQLINGIRVTEKVRRGDVVAASVAGKEGKLLATATIN